MTTEQLHPDLIEYIKPDINYVVSPLISEFYGSKELNRFVSDVYIKRKELEKKLLSERDYSTLLNMITRSFLLNYYIQNIYNHAKDNELFDHLSYIWCSTESPHVNKDVWIDIFSQHANADQFAQTKTNLKFPMTIYRGFSVNSDNDIEKHCLGLSWTTDKQTAIKLAGNSGRYNKNNSRYFIASTTISNKDNIFFFTDACNE